jgi:hypothetical protein
VFEEADLVHRYTRFDAIADGALIDVSAVAREAGIRFPVALTRAVWEEICRSARHQVSPGQAVVQPPRGVPECQAKVGEQQQPGGFCAMSPFKAIAGIRE